MRVCVLGAGIVGLATAWRLQREGHEVTVVDAQGVAAGASAANGAQLSYAYVQPLAGPQLWRQLPGLLADPQGPLRVRLQWDLQQWRWGLQFLAACREGRSRATTAALLALAEESRDVFESLRRREALDCDYAATGKLVLYPDQHAFRAARRQLALQLGLGAQQQALSPQECLQVEPALAGAMAGYVGGIYTPGECTADCLKVCLALQAIVQRQGGRFEFGARVERLLVHRGQVAAALTSRGPIEADSFVLCLGSGSARVAADLGLRLPLYPLKGYSITLPLPQGGTAPRVSVTDAARKTVFAPLGHRLRVAGMAELAGDDLGIDPARIAQLRQAAAALYPQVAADAPGAEPWCGLRPATPTGLPLLGAQARGPGNLLLNTGHGGLGFTLAFGSAQRVARLLHAPAGAAVRRAAAGPASCSA